MVVGLPQEKVLIRGVHAHGFMINHGAKGVLVPGAFGVTWVPALTMDACHVGGAVVVLKALWGAGRRDPIVPWEAVTNRPVPAHVTRRHRSTWTWIAGTGLPFVDKAVRSGMS